MKNNATSIIDSATLRRALKNLDAEPERIVVVAHSLTAEALALLEERDGLAFVTSEFYWTDERWETVRDKYLR